MKIGSITNAAPRLAVEQDVAKLGIRLTYALAAAYTAALAKTKWDALPMTCNITLIRENGNVNVAYGVKLRDLAEIAAFDVPTVVCKDSGTANFAYAHFVIDLTRVGAIRMGSKILQVDILGMVAGEIAEVTVLNSPLTATGLLKYDLVTVPANSPKAVNLIDGVSIAMPSTVTRVDIDFSNDQRCSYEALDVELIAANENNGTVNIDGTMHIIANTKVLPAELATAAVFYSSAIADVVVVRELL